MKIKMLTDFYSNGKVTFTGAGSIIEVDDNFGSYLLRTFPKWFEKVAETKEEPKKQSKKKVKVETK